MLVLSREEDESVVIVAGDHVVEVNVIRIQGSITKLGISAPKEVEIHRKEVYEAIRESNSEAAASGSLSTTKEILSSAAKKIRIGPGSKSGN